MEREEEEKRERDSNDKRHRINASGWWTVGVSVFLLLWLSFVPILLFASFPSSTPSLILIFSGVQYISMVEPKSNEVLVEPKVRRGKKVKAKKERKKSKVKVVDDIPAAQTPGASSVIETPPPPKDAERETEVVEESNPVLSCPPPDDVEDIQKEEEQREEEKGDQEGIDVLQGEDVASKGDTQGGTGVDGASKKQGSHRVSFMDIAACPTLARAAMVQVRIKVIG